MIEATETEIRCTTFTNESVNPTCERIDRLIRGYLQTIASSEAGWSVLYKDPGDGRFWELTYPHSEMHGGRSPLLMWLSDERARAKYGKVL
jgi:hypothetical protein